MSIVNLESALRTCKTNVANAERVLSDRFLNPRNMVCSVWNGLDAAGRVSCADGFKTKSAGCNSAEDRIGVENVLRPQYMTYISDNLGTSYNKNYNIPEGVKQEGFEMVDEKGFVRAQISDISGSAGFGIYSKVYPGTCNPNPYDFYSGNSIGI
jgi:hypothetical protein